MFKREVGVQRIPIWDDRLPVIIMTTKKGFTLIELLVTISIIGILIAISLFALQGARGVSRDAKRKSDLEAIRAALELYKSDCHKYPTASSLPSPLVGTVPPASCSASNTYMQEVPDDPLPVRDYYYNTADSGVTYSLCAALENPPASPWPNCGGGCGSGIVCNYKIVNP